MSTSDRESQDLSAAARRISASLIEGIHLRLDLFALELGEERRRFSKIVMTTLALALALFMVFLCINIALLVVFWDEHRVALALGMCGFYGAIAAVLAVVNARVLHRSDRPFEATREVLEGDRRTLRDIG